MHNIENWAAVVKWFWEDDDYDNNNSDTHAHTKYEDEDKTRWTQSIQLEINRFINKCCRVRQYIHAVHYPVLKQSVPVCVC